MSDQQKMKATVNIPVSKVVDIAGKVGDVYEAAGLTDIEAAYITKVIYGSICAASQINLESAKLIDPESAEKVLND